MTSTRAVLFPGQGAQFLGMAADLVEAYPEARAVFEAGREVLGRDLLAVLREGPEEDLNSTRTSQPAIFLHSMAVLEALGPELGLDGRYGRGLPALATAGLSLGEYSALVFAGAIEFEDALRVVAFRGECMQEACDASRGTMASVIGLSVDRVEEVVAEARAAGVAAGIANYNSPDQTVISGEEGAVDDLVKRLEAAGARRAIKLKVAGAYHSPLMAPAARKLEPRLRQLAIRAPRLPFLSNVTGAEVGDPEAIRSGLMKQVESPVRWTDIVRRLLDLGMGSALEVGPGRVLAGLVKGLQRGLEVAPVGDCQGVRKLKGAEVSA
jgi:[acyl-carrier-protein] S-malonyltransferase